MSSVLRIVSPSGAAYRSASGVFGHPAISQWLPFGTGMNGDVHAVAPYNGGLVAVGAFTTAGGVTVRGVAFWDGLAWSALGGGVGLNSTGNAYAVAVYGGNLYIGGLFSSVNGVSAANIAMWNGSTFSALGSGTDGDVYALHVFGSNLFIGGIFFTAGGSSAFGTAAWNGSSYVSVDSGSLIAITDFATFGGTLYSSNGLNGSPNLQSWDGSTWSNVTDSDVHPAGILGLDADATYLYVGTANAAAAGAVNFDCVGRYDGAAWSAPAGGLSGAGTVGAQDVRVWNSTITAGGNFTTPVANVARHSGSAFVGFGDGLNGGVLGLGTFNGYLVACGSFTASGAATRNRIAYWSVPE